MAYSQEMYSTLQPLSLETIFDEEVLRNDDDDDYHVDHGSIADSALDTEYDDYDDDDDIIVEIEKKIPCDCHKSIAQPLFELPIHLDQCAICYEELSMVNITVTRCGHTFHSSCVFNALEYGEHCPMCRTQLIELRVEGNDDDDDYSDDDSDGDGADEYGYKPIGKTIDDCYHFPVCIESFDSLIDVFNKEITGGVYKYNDGKLFMSLIVKLINKDFVTFDDEIDGIVQTDIETISIQNLMFILTRTQLLNKHMQCRAAKIKNTREISNILEQHLITRFVKNYYKNIANSADNPYQCCGRVNREISNNPPRILH